MEMNTGAEYIWAMLKGTSGSALIAYWNLPWYFSSFVWLWTDKPPLPSPVPDSLNYCCPSIKGKRQRVSHPIALNGTKQYLSSCFCSKSRRESSWLRCCRVRLWRGVLRSGGEAMLQLGTSWYWPPPRLSPQKLKMLETPEKAPAGERGERRVWNYISARAW